AQEKRNTPIRRPDRYDDTFIFERKPFTWPGGKTLAVWIIPNVEVWQFDSPAGAAISPNASNRVPDVINYAWRDYGMRVGLWRLSIPWIYSQKKESITSATGTMTISRSE